MKIDIIAFAQAQPSGLCLIASNHRAKLLTAVQLLHDIECKSCHHKTA